MRPFKRAAFWHVRLQQQKGGDGVRKASEAWRYEDPDNDATFNRIDILSDACDELFDDPEIVALRRAALKNAYRSEGVRRWFLPSALTAPRMAGIAATIALCFVTIFMLLGWGQATLGDAAQLADNAEAIAPQIVSAERLKAEPGATGTIYRTRTGERSVVTLPDGSVVTLNTETQFRARYTDGRRDIDLLKGQAVFTVEKDPRRPFRVFADGRIVTALGTEFEVRTDGDEFSVTLLEGRIAVAPVEQGDTAISGFEIMQPVALEAGQRLIVTAKGASVISTPDLGRAMGWREGRLEFENEKLSDAIREFNRYSNRKIVIGDPALDDLRIGGSFRINSMDNFILALEALYPVMAKRDAANDRIILHYE